MEFIKIWKSEVNFDFLNLYFTLGRIEELQDYRGIASRFEYTFPMHINMVINAFIESGSTSFVKFYTKNILKNP